MHGDAWEYTPCDGIMHICGCTLCVQYKEHSIIAEALQDTTKSSAWDVCDRFEQDLIRLGWDLAREGGHLPRMVNEVVGRLEQQIHRLKFHMESLKAHNNRASEQYNKILQELESERLDVSIRGWEIEFWQDQYEHLQERYTALEEQMLGHQPSVVSSPQNRDEDVQMRALPATLPRSDWENRPAMLVTASAGNISRLQRWANESGDNSSAHSKAARIAAARDDTNEMRECEFHAAQRRTNVNGERPPAQGRDHHCMAALVKVNGLEAYALLDLGSTTVSITHDFAQVAKLSVLQLVNPVPLQLGTVGSHSMINFGTKARLEVGSAIEDDAYLDVVNLDRYDMIIGIPFMRKHSLLLDFDRDILSCKGQQILTLTSGQEDLMLAKK